MPQKSATPVRPRAVQWDEKVPGLHLRTSATSSVYYFYYRTRARRERRYRIGPAKAIGLTRAREIARDLAVRVARGEDPAERPQTAPERTVQELSEWYTERHSKVRHKPSSAEHAEIAWRVHILPKLGKRKVAEVTRQDVADLHHAMRKTPAMANRVLEVLHKAYELAREEWGWVTMNPVTVEAYRENKRKRYPLKDEAVRMFAAMDEMRAAEPWFIGLVELLALTGARRDEIMRSRREWLREDGLHLPDSKVGERVLPLNEHAREVIEGIPVVTGNPYLIVGRKRGMHLVSPKKAWARLLKKAKITNLQMRDLRRFFASAGLSAGLTLEQVGQLLGHRNTQTTKRYAFLMQDAATRAANEAGEEIRRRAKPTRS